MPPSIKRARARAFATSGRQSKRQRAAESISSDVPDAGGQPQGVNIGEQPDNGVQDPQHLNAPGNHRAVLTSHS
jgi:hypothetical protein